MKIKSIPVPLDHARYEVVIGRNIVSQLQDLFQSLEYQHRRFAIITDKVVHQHLSSFLKHFSDIPTLVLEAGEKHKNLESVQKIYNFILDKQFDRKSVLIAIGGGVVGDMTGFTAATFMRGIDFYQVPTTLLSMVDSSIGGKTGVNLKEGKSLIGVFHQPKGVFVDLDLLSTLPEHQFNAGMAEIIKSGLLGDTTLFSLLENEPPLTATSELLEEVVQRACKIKIDIVVEDEKEVTGRRALLNLGHTFGHVIETVSGYTEYLHGEAVAIGTLMAARLSEIMGHLNEDDIKRIRSVFEKYQLPTKLKEPLMIDALEENLYRDKKVQLGELRFICLKSIGEAYIQEKVEKKWIHLIFKEAGAID